MLPGNVLKTLSIPLTQILRGIFAFDFKSKYEITSALCFVARCGSKRRIFSEDTDSSPVVSQSRVQFDPVSLDSGRTEKTTGDESGEDRPSSYVTLLDYLARLFKSLNFPV